MEKDYDYTGNNDEFGEMRELLIESYAITGRPHNWLFARFEDWRYGGNARRARQDPQFFARNAHLWRDETGRLVGFCLSEYGGNNVDLQVHPHHRCVEEAMLGWIESTWAQDRAYIETSACLYDEERQQRLARWGYADAGDNGYVRKYDLAREYDAVALPEGFRIETLAENRDYDGHVEAVRRAFDRPSLDRAWFDSKRRAPSYALEWDLCVVSPQGQHVAFCLAWLDLRNNIAEVDPIGTHPDYQRRGFGRAVVTECFRRLGTRGIRYAHIGSGPEPDVANRLYDALQPVEKVQDNCWVKTLRSSEKDR